MTTESAPARMLRMKAVMLKTSLSKSTIHRYVNAGHFPKPIQLGPVRCAWLESEVDAWIAKRQAERDGVGHE